MSGRIRVSILIMILAGLIFGITMGILASSDAFVVLPFLPIIFTFTIIINFVQLIRNSRACQEGIRHHLEHINRESVPRGVQWRYHQSHHHKRRSFYVRFIYVLLLIFKA